ncbi:MAG: YdcF family protein [Tractidigestivibacter sp.]|jgi:uncharacterized SAM-binding protein YcdF (DUF218 family)|uniref:YdcF family protein n=1 Tax=Tractidigestivibacter sp. TaxID=2847320 RepID=UPI003D934A61
MQTPNDSAIDQAAQTLFEFERIDDELEHCELSLALGNHDEHVAQHAASLQLSGVVDKILFTGGLGKVTSKLWSEPEALRFARIARSMGVPDNAILTETASTNTGENIRNSKEVLRREGLSGKRVIVVDRPARELRTKATLQAQWPELDFLMSPPPLGYRDYCAFYETDAPISKHEFIALMVGDLQRILVYPSLGYQTQQPVPDEVMAAYHTLIDLGFTDQLMKQA